MGINTSVNLRLMMISADNIAQYGYEMSVQFSNFLFHLKSMQEYWKSQLYTDFVKGINKEINKIGEIIKYFAETFPNKIVEKRNLYALADNEPPELRVFRKANEFERIILKEQDNEFEFKESAIQIRYNRICDVFDKIKLNIKQIESEFLSITWDGALAKAMKNEFEKEVELCNKKILLISKQLKEIITEQKKAMKEIEEDTTLGLEEIDESNIKRKIAELNFNTDMIEKSNNNWEDNN